MSELVVVGFKNNRSRAAAVLGELRSRDEAWTAGLHGAIAMYRDDEGKLIVDEAYESTKGSGAIGGGFIGSLLGLAIAALTLPLTAGLSGIVAAGSLVAGAVGGSIIGAQHGSVDNASWWKDEVNIPEDFLAAIRQTVLQNDSAIFFLLRAPDHSGMAARFREYGGTVLHATLTDEQMKKVKARVEPPEQSHSHQYRG
ncbi:MAG TPA: DUF1269 domain-containing protein [Kofleriaceae bacterium]